MNRVQKISLVAVGLLCILMLLINWRLFRSVLQPQSCLYGPPVTDYQEPSEATDEPQQEIEPDSANGNVR